MMANIYYIRAAIRESTGYDLPIDEVVDLLLEEQLITHRQAESMRMRDYGEVYSHDYSIEDIPILDEEQEEDEIE